eukprot:14270152-Alexandrium_andersonii.AAC.1
MCIRDRKKTYCHIAPLRGSSASPRSRRQAMAGAAAGHARGRPQRAPREAGEPKGAAHQRW